MRTATILSFLFFTLSVTAQQTFTAADSLRGMLTPLRTSFDVHFYELDVIIDPDDRSVSGSNAIHFKVLHDLDRLQIDLFDNLTIDSIVWKGVHLPFERKHHAVFVTFPQVLRSGEAETVIVFYRGRPIVAKAAPWDGGFVWKRDANGNHHVGVACEGLGASSWWPNKDHLSDEPDSMMMHFTAPNGLVCVGNGRQVAAMEGETHTRWSYKVSNPINNYNVSVNIGDYVHFSDWHVNGSDSLRLNYYVLRDNLERAREHFKQVGPMLTIFEEAFGPYPFYEDGYALIETTYAGMEHQSGIAYGNRFMKGYEGRYPSDMDFDYIIVHETGHEWWGNSVSMNDLADMWVHESFCTYSESVFVEATYGHDKMMEYLAYQKNFITNRSRILGVHGMNCKGNSRDMYYKGTWMLHSLRSAVNDDALFRSMLRSLAMEFRHSNVDGTEVIAFINRFLGRDLTPFFRQYLNHAELPVLEYSLKRGELRLRWKADEPGFAMPIEVVQPDGTTVRVEKLTDQWLTVPMKGAKEVSFREDRFLFLPEKVADND